MLSFAALADPTRRRIVEMLAERERAAGEIVAEFAMSAPAISQHLKILRDAHLVRVRSEGQRRIHTIDPAGFDEIEAWIAQTRRFWSQKLDALERELEADTDSDQRSKP